MTLCFHSLLLGNVNNKQWISVTLCVNLKIKVNTFWSSVLVLIPVSPKHLVRGEKGNYTTLTVHFQFTAVNIMYSEGNPCISLGIKYLRMSEFSQLQQGIGIRIKMPLIKLCEYDIHWLNNVASLKEKKLRL